MLKISENNGTEEIGLVTPTPDGSVAEGPGPCVVIVICTTSMNTECRR